MKKCLLCLLAVLLSSTPIFANRGLDVTSQSNRIALVIGNGAYKVGPLKNPVNDASDIASVLKQKGFSVSLLTNATQRQMEKAIGQFGKQLRDGGVGLFFYAGHGMQVSGSNYLIPIGANIEAESDIKYESVNANRVLSKMEEAGNDLNMVFLDACRNNPFARSFRSSGKGLAQMDAPKGSFVAFATAPGSIASDGTGRNGLFTGELIQHMQVPGLELTKMMKEVRKQVLRESEDKQTPWDVSSLTGDFYFTDGIKKDSLTVAGGSFQREESGKGRLRVASEPDRAEIYIDDIFSGTSPLDIKLKSGIYTIAARKRDFKNESKRIRLFEDQDLKLTLILDKKGSSLFIASTPSGAEVTIDNAYSGQTPLDLKGLNPGQRLSIKVSKKGYQNWIKNISIGNTDQQVQASLKKKSIAPEGMVLIPAGGFEMGSNSGDSDEKPVHNVNLVGYYIDKLEVTVGQYEKCYNAGNCKRPDTGSYNNWGKSGRNNHPINGVSWHDAQAYCEYAGKRLPTEAEWEKAATWKDGRKYKYPSGKNSVSCADAVMDEGGDGCGKDRIWSVRSKPKEINGTYDMAGNVWEWVADRKGNYSSGFQQNPTGPSSGSGRVFRGGSWIDAASDLRGANRYSFGPSRRFYYIGFRCASSPK
jgi:formylglycine-generating enzyme required for sulfatase activity